MDMKLQVNTYHDHANKDDLKTFENRSTFNQYLQIFQEIELRL